MDIGYFKIQSISENVMGFENSCEFWGMTVIPTSSTVADSGDKHLPPYLSSW